MEENDDLNEGCTVPRTDCASESHDDEKKELSGRRRGGNLVILKVRPSTADRIRRYLASEYLRTGKYIRIADLVDSMVDVYLDGGKGSV